MNFCSECIVLRDFENLTKAGSGGFGFVLRAKKKGEQFFSAIKLIPMDSPTNHPTLDEAKKVSAIAKHDSIVTFLDYWVDVFTKVDHENFLKLVKPKKSEPFYYFPTGAKQLKFLCIRMEFCENGTLKHWLKNRKSFDVCENIQIFIQLARGVEHIHASKLIHRDVKPANILFYKKNAKISDFGWSATHNVGEYQHTPRAGAALYQTPEQAYGVYGQSTDYYALGLILFELFYPEAQKNIGITLTNLKFTREMPMEIKLKYPIVADLICKMISIQPNERPNCNNIVRMIKPLLDVVVPKPENSLQSSNKCNDCSEVLDQIRYKCTICTTFFLCESCEGDDEDHTKMHNFIKIKTSKNSMSDQGCEHYRRKCKLKVKYRVTGDDQYFQRTETCKIVKKEDSENSEFLCSGSTKYHKIDASASIENITNHDQYMYSSEGFEHLYFEYENGEYSHLYDTFEVANFVPRDHTLLTRTQNRIAKKLEYTENGNKELIVTLSVNVTDFSLVRREKFTIKDDGDGNFDFHCDGDLKLTDSEFIQNEEFTVCRNIGFLYSNTEINPEVDVETEDYIEEK